MFMWLKENIIQLIKTTGPLLCFIKASHNLTRRNIFTFWYFKRFLVLQNKFTVHAVAVTWQHSKLSFFSFIFFQGTRFDADPNL